MTNNKETPIEKAIDLIDGFLTELDDIAENSKQQTAVEWQHIELSKFLNGKSEFTDAHDILIKAKEMEKERMIQFACDVFDKNYKSDASFKDTAKHLYQQTYGGGEQ